MENINEALEWIYSIRGSAWRRKLDRMERLVEVLGIPEGGSRPLVHVGGTNGKGSTVSMTEAMLRAAGYSTGHCVSPYVYSVRERVQAFGKLIPDEDFVALTIRLKEAVEELSKEGFGTCTVFEVFTAMAFAYWEEKQVDIGVVEVGLGGTLDSTNVIDPVVSAIVSVSWDHIEVLGGSLEEIAEEKSGIIKPGRPCVVGDMTAECRKPLTERAKEVGAPLSIYSKDWFIEADKDSPEFTLECPFGRFDLRKPRRLPGAIQVHNAGVAVQCFLHATEGKLDHEAQLLAIYKGLETAFLPGRFEVLRRAGRTWVFDGAHNEQSMAELVRTFRLQFPGIKPTVLFGMLNRHDPKPCGDLLKFISDDIWCVPIHWESSEKPEELARTCEFGKWFSTLEQAVTEVDSEVVVVTGSFYLLYDCLRMLDLIDRT